MVFPAQFYNALRIGQNASAVSWPLMDRVIKIHSEERLFVGARPHTLKDCFKQAALLLGVSPTEFARNKRPSKLLISKKGPRGLKSTTPLGEIFHSGLASDGSAALTMHNIEELLNEQALDEILLSNVGGSKKLRREWDKSHRLTPIQLLESLQTSLPAELPKLEFDYFHMHEQSITLLRKVRSELDADFRK